MSNEILELAPPSPEPSSSSNSFRLKRGSKMRSSSSSRENPRCKPSLSSMFLSLAFANTLNKRSFRNLGCSSAPEVYHPSASSAQSMVRSAADWEGRRSVRKGGKKSKRDRKKKTQIVDSDVWCAPGIPFSSEADSVDCVLSPQPVMGRNRQRRLMVPQFSVGPEFGRRERLLGTRSGSSKLISDFDSAPMFETLSPINYRHLRGLRHSSREMEELIVLQSNLLLGGMDTCDRFRDLRLDVDNMTYEELLELGEKIGHVNTGLSEEQIRQCMRTMKHSSLASRLSFERKCSICQEEYEAKDEVGKLECGHNFHWSCIKQWLLKKNACPVCKTEIARS